MKFIEEVDTAPIAYSAANPAPKNIGAKSYYIESILSQQQLAKTDSASPTTYQDYFWRTITSLVVGGNGKPYCNVTYRDLRLAYWWMRQRMQGGFRGPDLVAGSVTMYGDLPLIFTPEPLLPNGQPNWFGQQVLYTGAQRPGLVLDSKGKPVSGMMDVGMAVNDHVIPSGIFPSSDLNFTPTWAANTAIGTNRTVGTTTELLLSYYGVVFEPGDTPPASYPVFSTSGQDPTATASGLNNQIQIQTGFRTRRLSHMITNGTLGSSDVRNSGYGTSAISQLAIKNAAQTQLRFWQTPDFVRQSQARFEVADDDGELTGQSGTLHPGISVVSIAYNAGVGNMDFGHMVPTISEFGFDLRNESLGALNINRTIDTATNTGHGIFQENYLDY